MFLLPVRHQAVSLRKANAAERAYVRSYSAVRHDVLPHYAFLLEAQTAPGTFVGSLASVNELVLFQQLRLCKFPVALVAGKVGNRFLSFVTRFLVFRERFVRLEEP